VGVTLTNMERVSQLGSRKDRMINEAARRRAAKMYGDMLKENNALLKKEVGWLLSDMRKSRKLMGPDLSNSLKRSCQEMASDLHRWIGETKKNRLQAAGQDAQLRAAAARNNTDSTREYLQGFNSQHRERTRVMRENRVLYVKRLVNGDRSRINGTKKYMNGQRKYLLDLLDQDFGVKRNYV